MGKGPNPKRGESLPVCTPSAQFQDVHQGKATRRPASLQQDALGAALRECEPTTIPLHHHAYMCMLHTRPCVERGTLARYATVERPQL